MGNKWRVSSALHSDFWPIRTLIHSDRYVTEARAIQPDVRKFDQYVNAAEWAIATNPEYYPVIESTGSLRAVPVEQYGERCVIYFTIDDETSCTLHSVRKEESELGPEDIPF